MSGGVAAYVRRIAEAQREVRVARHRIDVELERWRRTRLPIDSADHREVDMRVAAALRGRWRAVTGTRSTELHGEPLRHSRGDD